MKTVKLLALIIAVAALTFAAQPALAGGHGGCGYWVGGYYPYPYYYSGVVYVNPPPVVAAPVVVQQPVIQYPTAQTANLKLKMKQMCS